jgi:regulator of sigma E protease
MTGFLSLLVHNPAQFLLNAGAIVFVFGVIIFVHEGGHFLMAKKSGVKVEQFSFGFGREIFGFQKGETRYTVNWIPLGGFVRMAGEMPDNYDGPAFEGKTTTEAADRDKSREFMAQPWQSRLLIAAAGPVTNYGLSIALFFLILTIKGQAIQTNPTEVGTVMDGKPAAHAGLKPGDKVLSVEGVVVEDFVTLASKIQERPLKDTLLRVQRGGNEMEIHVVPEADKSRGGVGIIGIRPAAPVEDHKKIGVGEAGKLAVRQCWNLSKFTLVYLGQKIMSHERPDVAGPLGITQVIVKAVKTGWEDFFYLIGMISVAIGLFNFFPIPLLDGGHMLYYAIEGIRGRPLSQKVMSRANMVGFAFLISLFVFATFNDIQRIGSERAKPTATEPAAVAPAK